MPSRFQVSTQALRRPDFRHLWAGLGLSQAGNQVTTVAVAYQLWQLTHSPWNLGLVGFFRFLPIALAAFVAGPMADSRDRRRLMLVTQSTLCANSALMAFLSHRGLVTPGVVYLFVFVAGTAFAFDNPARQSLVTNLVPAEELPNALSLNITVFQLATIGGPALAGLLLRLRGPWLAYTVDACSFGALIFALVSMKYRAPFNAKPLTLNFAAFGEGLRFMLGKPEMLWLMLLDFIATFFAGSMQLLPAFADRVLHVDVRGLSLMYAAPAVGAVLAAVFLAGRPPIVRQGPVVLWSVAAYGLSIAAFGATRSFPLALLFLALSGTSDTISMVVRNTVRQLLTPNEMRGRMTSLNQLFFVGGPQLGEVEAGGVAKLTSAPFSVVSGGLSCVLAAGLVAAGVPRLRKLRGVTGVR